MAPQTHHLTQITELRCQVADLRGQVRCAELRERIITEILRRGYAPSHAVTEAERVYKFITEGK